MDNPIFLRTRNRVNPFDRQGNLTTGAIIGIVIGVILIIVIIGFLCYKYCKG